MAESRDLKNRTYGTPGRVTKIGAKPAQSTSSTSRIFSPSKPAAAGVSKSKEAPGKVSRPFAAKTEEASEKKDSLSKSEVAQELIEANRKAEAASEKRLRAENKHYENELNVLKDQADRNMEAIAGLHEKLDKSNENTHDTGVRIYRNVQAAVVSENEKQTKLMTEELAKLNARIDELEELVVKSSNSVLSILVLVGLIANLVLTVLIFMGFSF